ncbi:type I polyketide synthase [Streptomyces collinus]|uniref:type I polyketide synthase n=1 Tax=Streptomyces collinus TaxID=42684 RepID=UPI00363E94D6
MRAARTTERAAVAVVGLGCAFPGANGPQEFWDRLLTGTDSVTVVPADRFDIAEHYSSDPQEPGRTVSRHGGFLTDAFAFDAGFFGISPAEAAEMDPQQRLLLQVVWESLEDAGLAPSDLAGSRTGVFVGQATADYDEVHHPLDARTTVRGAAGRRLRAVTAGRVSYALDLRGPSVVLDTACSSSLVAVHAARQSLLTGESDLALAGGVNLILSPQDAIVYSQSGMLSADGRCKFGDASGDGFVRSEGVGVVVLKRLSDALRDGDQVRALLLGTAVCNDGRGSGLLLKPAESGHVAAIEEACVAAGISPGQVDYVEAHGTGTPVGDGVELAALASVNHDRDATRPLRVGSVKTNIGHPEAAAGMAGLIKAVLMAEHGVIPASLHCAEPHPLLASGALPLRLVTENEPLARNGDRALIGVTSLGLSGTNAHAILAEFTQPTESTEPADGEHIGAGAVEPTGQERRAERRPLLVLSARTPASLRGLARAYASHLCGPGSATPLVDLCAAAALRRDHHPFRLWVTAATHQEMADRLLALARGEEIADGGTGEAGFDTDRRTALVFPGQGSQWKGMGRGLLAASPAFRTTLSRCADAVCAELGWSPLELLTDDRADLTDDVQTVQPLLWAVEVALAAALREAGLRPDLCIGHSMGEVAAAQVSGALALRDAAAVICRRSRLMSRAAGRGGMLLVGLSADEAQQIVANGHPGIRVAAENAPRATVLAGPGDELAQLMDTLERQGVICHPVRVDVPSHSPVMEEIRQDMLDSLADLTPRRPELPMISTVRGHDLVGADSDSAPDAAYWAENLCGPVHFTRAVRNAAKADDTVFVEVSPHPLLSSGIKDTLSAHAADGAVVATLRRGQDETDALARTVGQVYAAGASMDWTRWFDRETTPGVRLPTYVWDTRDYLPATSARRPHAADVRTRTVSLAEWAHDDSRRDALTVWGNTPVPAVVHLLAAIDAVRDVCGRTTPVLRAVRLSSHVLDAREAASTTLTVEIGAPGRDGTRPVSVTSTRAGETVPHAEGEAAAADVPEGTDPAAGLAALDAALARCSTYLPRHRFEALARRHGITIGPGLSSVEQLWCGDGEFVARVRRPSLPGPAAWEAGLLPLVSAWPEVLGSVFARRADAPGTGYEHLYVPEEFGEVRVLGDLSECFWSVGTCAPAGPDSALADVRMYAPDGSLLASFTGIRLRRFPAEAVPIPGPAAVPSVGAVAGWLTERLLPPVVSRTLQGIGSALLGAMTSGSDALADAAERTTPAVAASLTVAEPPQPADTDRPRSRTAPDPHQVLLDLAADLLGLPAAQVDVRRPLSALGLDSLMAVHLRQRLLVDHGIDVPVRRLLSQSPIADLLDEVTAA